MAVVCEIVFAGECSLFAVLRYFQGVVNGKRVSGLWSGMSLRWGLAAMKRAAADGRASRGLC